MSVNIGSLSLPDYTYDSRVETELKVHGLLLLETDRDTMRAHPDDREG